jgi:hypothetical protein
MTPCISFGVSASMMKPVKKPMTRGAANAFSSLDPTITMSTPLGSIPAARRIGSDCLARISSISVSRISDSPSCADAATGALARPSASAAVRKRREIDRTGKGIFSSLLIPRPWPPRM